ncbi:DUF134 domain-containing protein [Pseudoramibacter alactolyticus]|uniref:DUF134 domain-containing protein n=1 Tax=Pseudoramibacter alactolyticus TaxID=113287 RepID=UPI002354C469|nr:DUF134 domain-containing protein [Pseudoramibacter alactolyticus]MBM6967449.1 DUF134 domain-containing protein [Pseudoramibacter alactolyticus]
MARPCKKRRIGGTPGCRRFGPGRGGCPAERAVTLSVEEYETLRRIDYEGLSQADCAAVMAAGRTTVQAIYRSARKKLATALVEARPLIIGGGDYILTSAAAPISKGENMEQRIAVTYDNGQIFQHFGHTSQFKIYDIQDGAVAETAVVDTNGQGHGALGGFLRNADVDALICGGIGGGARMALADADVALYAGVTGEADAAVAALLAGTLAYQTETNCDHHGEHHHCGHHHHGEGSHCGRHGEGEGHHCGRHGENA